MDTDKVIMIRDNLKAGMNLPVRIIFADTMYIADEANTATFTKWDDSNELITVVKLPDPQTDRDVTNIEGCVSVFSTSYANIQAIENSYTPIDVLDTILQNFGVPSEKRENVVKSFGQLLRIDLPNFRHADFNRIMGADVLPTHDYYSEGYRESFLESRATAENNKYVDSKKAASSSGE